MRATGSRRLVVIRLSLEVLGGEELYKNQLRVIWVNLVPELPHHVLKRLDGAGDGEVSLHHGVRKANLGRVVVGRGVQTVVLDLSRVPLVGMLSRVVLVSRKVSLKLGEGGTSITVAKSFDVEAVVEEAELKLIGRGRHLCEYDSCCGRRKEWGWKGRSDIGIRERVVR